MAIAIGGAVAGLLIPAIGEIGFPLLKKLLKVDPEWLEVIEDAIRNVPTAVAAIRNLIKGQQEGKDWTADELRTMLAEARELHDAIQATGDKPE